MSTYNIEAMKSALVELNKQIAEKEQEGEAAKGFFEIHLSDQLIFRRASGRVVGKSGLDGFVEGLKSNPFKSRVVEDVAVSLQDDRALVTLIVVGTRKDDGSVHYYRNIRFFSRSGDQWVLELWYNFEIGL